MRSAVSVICCLTFAVASPALADIPIPALAVKNARAELREGTRVEVDARVQYSGELLLFDSPEAMRLGLVFPYCISAGIAPRMGHAKASELAGRRVRVKGTLLRYERTRDEEYTISTSTEIGGMFFKNWCFGPYVLRIEKLTIVKQEVNIRFGSKADYRRTHGLKPKIVKVDFSSASEIALDLHISTATASPASTAPT